MKKLYIAAALKDVDEVEKWTEEFKRVGLELTFNWVVKFRKKLHPRPKDMITAVKECDLFILLCKGGRGAHTELGIALATEKKILIVGAEEYNSRPLFYNENSICHIGTMQDAFYKTIKLLLEN